MVIWYSKDLKICNTKFDALWHGLYRIQLALPNNIILLINEDNYNLYHIILNTNKLFEYKFTSSSPTWSQTISFKDFNQIFKNNENLESSHNPNSKLNLIYFFKIVVIYITTSSFKKYNYKATFFINDKNGGQYDGIWKPWH